MKIQIVCFKWTPRPNQLVTIPSQTVVKYNSDHVNRLFKMVDRYVDIPYEKVCVTDDPTGIDGDVRIVPLWDKCRDMGGCFNRLYVFSSEMKDIIGERMLCLDMDMIITANLTDIITRFDSADFVHYKMRGADGTGSRMNNGMFMMNAGARNFVWDDFIFNPSLAREKARIHAGTDQAWCNYILDLKREKYWSINDGIYDMRLDFIEGGRIYLPRGCRIVMWPRT